MAGSGFNTGTVKTLPLQREVETCLFVVDLLILISNFIYFLKNCIEYHPHYATAAKANDVKFNRIVMTQVTDVHADTRKSFKPQHRSLLFKLQRRDPVEQENNGEVLSSSINIQNDDLKVITISANCLPGKPIVFGSL